MSLARELINHMIPPLKLNDSTQRAITWMEELRTNQLPVVKDGRFMGLISDDIIMEGNEIDKKVSDYQLIGENCYVHENQHLYEIIKLATDNGVQVIAVLNDNSEFVGTITVQDLIAALAQTSAVQSPGGIIILSLPQIDYSLAEISRLIEAENVKILNSSVSPDFLDPSKIRLTLKLNQIDVSRVVATLERFNYKIIAKYQESPLISNEKERIDILLKYLEI